MTKGRRIYGETRAGDEALELWSSEVAAYERVLNGWANESLFSRLARQGPLAASQAGSGAPSVSNMALAIDRAVCFLPAKTRRVVVLWYCSRNKGNQTLCAREASMSHRWFRHHLKIGRDEIAKILGLTVPK